MQYIQELRGLEGVTMVCEWFAVKHGIKDPEFGHVSTSDVEP